MRTANPAFNTKTFADFQQNLGAQVEADKNVMTVQGAINKTGFLLVLCFAAAALPWGLAFQAGNLAVALPFMMVGIVASLILCLVTVFKKTWAKVTAPLYAIAEGLLLGGLSAYYEAQFPGIPLQAIGLTFGVLVVMLGLYSFRIIKVSKKFMTGVIAATGAIALMYIFSFVMSMFGMPMGFMHSSGWLSIGISFVVVGVAALNLVLDFHLLEEGAKARAPKYMEWYAAFGILVTLVWLYIEILRLLSKLSSRD